MCRRPFAIEKIDRTKVGIVMTGLSIFASKDRIYIAREYTCHVGSLSELRRFPARPLRGGLTIFAAGLSSPDDLYC